MKRITRYELSHGRYFEVACKPAKTKSFLILGIVKVTACMGHPASDSCASCGALLSNVDLEPKEIKK